MGSLKIKTFLIKLRLNCYHKKDLKAPSLIMLKIKIPISILIAKEAMMIRLRKIAQYLKL